MAPLSNRLIMCGISHKTSTLEERAPLGFGHADLAQANAEFSDISEIIESCIMLNAALRDFSSSRVLS